MRAFFDAPLSPAAAAAYDDDDDDRGAGCICPDDHDSPLVRYRRRGSVRPLYKEDEEEGGGGEDGHPRPHDATAMPCVLPLFRL